MTSPLVAGAPLEPARHRIGRRSAVLVDGARLDRIVGVDQWYPAAAGSIAELSVYELLPGVGFTAAAEQDVVVAGGAHPLVVWSHGRTGTRTSYALLCEALAARGFMVLSLEHAGDALGDWILGAAVDDATNEANRIADTRFVLDAVFDPAGPLPGIHTHVDLDRVAIAGHSYGGYTALAVAGDATPDPRVRAIAGLESFTRTIPIDVFERIAVPTLLVVGAKDATTPATTDADPAWEHLGAANAVRIDVERAGHQACSDVGLYLEVAPKVEGLPPIVQEYLASMAPDITGTPGDPWRDTVALHVRLLAAFLDGALGIDGDSATQEMEAVSRLSGVHVESRGGFAPVHS